MNPSSPSSSPISPPPAPAVKTKQPLIHEQLRELARKIEDDESLADPASQQELRTFLRLGNDKIGMGRRFINPDNKHDNKDIEVDAEHVKSMADQIFIRRSIATRDIDRGFRRVDGIRSRYEKVKQDNSDLEKLYTDLKKGEDVSRQRMSKLLTDLHSSELYLQEKREEIKRLREEMEKLKQSGDIDRTAEAGYRGRLVMGEDDLRLMQEELDKMLSEKNRIEEGQRKGLTGLFEACDIYFDFYPNTTEKKAQGDLLLKSIDEQEKLIDALILANKNLTSVMGEYFSRSVRVPSDKVDDEAVGKTSNLIASLVMDKDILINGKARLLDKKREVEEFMKTPHPLEIDTKELFNSLRLKPDYSTYRTDIDPFLASLEKGLNVAELIKVEKVRDDIKRQAIDFGKNFDMNKKIQRDKRNSVQAFVLGTVKRDSTDKIIMIKVGGKDVPDRDSNGIISILEDRIKKIKNLPPKKVSVPADIADSVTPTDAGTGGEETVDGKKLESGNQGREIFALEKLSKLEVSVADLELKVVQKGFNNLKQAGIEALNIFRSSSDVAIAIASVVSESKLSEPRPEKGKGKGVKSTETDEVYRKRLAAWEERKSKSKENDSKARMFKKLEELKARLHRVMGTDNLNDALKKLNDDPKHIEKSEESIEEITDLLAGVQADIGRLEKENKDVSHRSSEMDKTFSKLAKLKERIDKIGTSKEDRGKEGYDPNIKVDDRIRVRFETSFEVLQRRFNLLDTRLRSLEEGQLEDLEVNEIKENLESVFFGFDMPPDGCVPIYKDAEGKTRVDASGHSVAVQYFDEKYVRANTELVTKVFNAPILETIKEVNRIMRKYKIGSFNSVSIMKLSMGEAAFMKGAKDAIEFFVGNLKEKKEDVNSLRQLLSVYSTTEDPKILSAFKGANLNADVVREIEEALNIGYIGNQFVDDVHNRLAEEAVQNSLKRQPYSLTAHEVEVLRNGFARRSFKEQMEIVKAIGEGFLHISGYNAVINNYKKKSVLQQLDFFIDQEELLPEPENIFKKFWRSITSNVRGKKVDSAPKGRSEFDDVVEKLTSRKLKLKFGVATLLAVEAAEKSRLDSEKKEQERTRVFGDLEEKVSDLADVNEEIEKVLERELSGERKLVRDRYKKSLTDIYSFNKVIMSELEGTIVYLKDNIDSILKNQSELKSVKENLRRVFEKAVKNIEKAHTVMSKIEDPNSFGLNRVRKYLKDVENFVEQKLDGWSDGINRTYDSGLENFARYSEVGKRFSKEKYDAIFCFFKNVKSSSPEVLKNLKASLSGRVRSMFKKTNN